MWEMNFWGDVGSLLQGVVSLFTLVTIVYVLRQTNEMKKQNVIVSDANLATVYQNTTEIMRDIEKIFIEHPNWRPYFYENKKLSPKNRDYKRLIPLAEMYVDFMDLVLVLKYTTSQHSDGSESLIAGKWSGWLKYFKYIYENSPIVRDYWRENCEWYPQDLHELLETPTLPPAPLVQTPPSKNPDPKTL